MRITEVAACPGCGGSSYSSFEWGVGARLRRCAACDLVFGAEAGDPEELYVDGYLTGGTDYGLDVTNPLFQEMLDNVGEARMRSIAKVTRPPGTFLDVGCGTGEVLKVARRHGWDVAGAEPVAESARMAREAHGLDVRAEMLEESGFPERSFDVVGAFHVLEHMTDGLGFLQLIARWAKPGGHVVIEVPNWRSMHRRGAGPAWSGLRLREHIAYYTPATMAATMRRAGLEPVAVTTPTYLFHRQNLDEALVDVGLHRMKRYLKPLARVGTRNGKEEQLPHAAGWAALRTVARIEQAARVGVVVLAIARVP
jgi:2-polyprenyl-3-methyl-5-hydroxy-6-metoxy-1,4-benzoquinol methylase